MTVALTAETATADFLGPSQPGLHELAEALKLLASGEDAEPPIHVGYDEAARRLNIPEGWLRERIASLPHRKLGRYVQFTDGDLRAISEMHFVQPCAPSEEEREAPIVPLQPSKRSRKYS
jgi:hypothetical protein